MSTSHDASAHAAMRALMMPATLPDPEKPGQEIEFNQTDRNVYAYLVYRANGARLCWKTISEIQADLGIRSRHTVCDATGKLRRAGLIEVKHRRRDSNHYRILDPGHRLYSGSSGNGATEWQQQPPAPPPQDVQEMTLLEPQGVQDSALLEDSLDVQDSALLEPQGVQDSALLGVLDVQKTAQESLNQDKITKGKLTKSARASRAGTAVGRRAKVNVSDLEFSIFWDLYPRKTGEHDAAAAFSECVKAGTPASEIIAGLKCHQFRDNPNFIPYPANWLRRGHWKDKPPPGAFDWIDDLGGDLNGTTIDGEAVHATRPH